MVVILTIAVKAVFLCFALMAVCYRYCNKERGSAHIIIIFDILIFFFLFLIWSFFFVLVFLFSHPKEKKTGKLLCNCVLFGFLFVFGKCFVWCFIVFLFLFFFLVFRLSFANVLKASRLDKARATKNTVQENNYECNFFLSCSTHCWFIFSPKYFKNFFNRLFSRFSFSLLVSEKLSI